MLLDDRELKIAIRELIHDLQDYPSGRIVFRQKESEDLVFQIRQLQTASSQSLDDREAVLGLRDKLKILCDMENAVVGGLRLLFGHKDLKDYACVVWEQQASLLVRSFVEQGIDLNLSTVTGLEKIRLHPPGNGDDPLAVFMPPADIQDIWDHRQNLMVQYPRLETDTIGELPNHVQFRYAVPAVIRRIVFKMENGVPLEQMERRMWLDTSAWKVTF